MKKDKVKPTHEESLEIFKIFNRSIEMVRTSETHSHLFASRRYFENYCQMYGTKDWKESVFEFESEKKRIEFFKQGFKNKN